VILVPDIPVAHDRRSRLVIAAVFWIVRIDFYLGYRHMEKVHIDPPTGIEPDLHE
jgi:hypothetical protein